MGAMQLKNLITSSHTLLCRLAEPLNQKFNFGLGQGAGRQLFLILTGIDITGTKSNPSLNQRPRHAHSTMLKLQTWNRAGLFNDLDQPTLSLQVFRRIERQLTVFG